MTKLRRLIESAKNIKKCQEVKTEDGTVADLGPAPTGHKLDEKLDKEDIE